MKYGVIVCPKCGSAKGVESAKKTTTCQCGREIKLTRMKLMFMTDSPHELAQTVAKVNASLKGGEPMPREKKRRARTPSAISEKVAATKDPRDRMRLMVADLAASKSEFNSEDIRKVAISLGTKMPDNLVERLLELGIIYEVGPGRFKAV